MEVKRKLNFHLGELTFICGSIKEKEDGDSCMLEVKLEEIEDTWKNLKIIYEKIMAMDEMEKESADLIKYASSKFRKARMEYQTSKAKLMDMIKNRDTSFSEQNPKAETTMTHSGSSALKLPSCDCPPFDGGYAKWPAFRDIFTGVFINHPELSPVQKLYHLRNKTRGEANHIVQKFELVDKNFNLAWSALKNRYENHRILIHQQMKKLFGLPAATSESAESIRQIQTGIDDSISIFTTYNLKMENCDPFLVYICYTKLSKDTLSAWEDSLNNHKEFPTWAQMYDFLSKRIEVLETLSDLGKPNIRENKNNRPQSFQTHAVVKKPYCKKCKQEHTIRQCQYFRAMPVNERIKFAFANKYCMNCLSSNHFKSKCTSTSLCNRCNGKHHTMLHLDKNRGDDQRNYSHDRSASNNQPSTSSFRSTSNSLHENNASTEEVISHFSRNEGTTILPTALIQAEIFGDVFMIRALLDSGSEKSFISKRAQEKLGLPIMSHKSQISGLGGTIVGNSSGKCFVDVKSRSSDFKIKIEAIVVSKLAHFIPSKKVEVGNYPELSNLMLADPFFYKPSPIDMIIGSDYLPVINKTGVRTNIGKGLEARESQFGWYLSGPMPSINNFSTCVTSMETENLLDEIKRFWEIEEIETQNKTSISDEYCEDYYQQTTYRQTDGRYVVRLPFKENFPKEIYLGRSRNMALAQYYRMETNLRKNPFLKTQYEIVLQEYIDLDHMEQVISIEDAAEKQSAFYLPHHAVIKPESKTTQVRVVFNASKKSSSGYSLNDVLHRGPVLQTDLLRVLLRWRLYHYAFTGDIQKMYRQIIVHPDDRPYQKLFYRKSPKGNIETYELKTVTFGVNCAPFLAIRTLKQLSKDNKSTYPEGALILEKEVYVDDVLSGGHTMDEAKSKQMQVKELLNSAGFPMKKITANNSNLLNYLAREDLLDEDFLKIDESSSTKTLGIHWNAMSDTFSYRIMQLEIVPVVQMKNVLSVIARLYDPLGWLGPVVVNAKLIMQKLWELKMDWNDMIPENLMVKWNTFLKSLPHVTQIQIPRWTKYSPDSKIEIHGFCDASENAYCGVIYLRTVDLKGGIYTHQMMAKTKVAPLKRLTIPKLELCGAVLLSKLIEIATDTVPGEHEIYMWTDSSIVLGWLQKNPKQLKTFVSNRVAEIQNRCINVQWRHVVTSENPADLGSRGCSPQEIVKNNLWWQGPSWLSRPQADWPTPRIFEPTELETKKIVSLHIEVHNEDIISRFSSLGKALRVVGQMFRFQKLCLKGPPHEDDIINADEIKFAKNRLITIAQKIYYPREYESLCRKKPLSRKSPLVTLVPFLDTNLVMRVGGRLQNSSLRYDEMHPIIVPNNSHYAVLLVRYTHQILFHAEHHTMMRAIRQGYFIPRLRNLIKACIRECKTCTMYKQKFQNQLMGALPPERVTFTLPFTHTGVDFAGPFNMKTSSLRNAKLMKGYIAVFVCFSTRAVHLEVCSDLTADAFLAAFARFIGRRGQPKTLFSDNGRNFVGANYKMLKEHNKFLKSIERSLVDRYSVQGLTWTFIPPYAPHMGGLWEAAVKSMKSHLKKVAANVNFTFEELSTLLSQIEAILNSRPLSPITEDANDVLPLTPGHFLRGAPLTAPPEVNPNSNFDDISNLNRWQRLKAMYHHFSRRWKSEYIVLLQKRYKWNAIRNNLKEGDIVIVKEDFLPPMEWCLGRITKVFHGKDNNVRVAEVKTKRGLITRSVVKLCVLPTTTPSTAINNPLPTGEPSKSTPSNESSDKQQ